MFLKYHQTNKSSTWSKHLISLTESWKVGTIDNFNWFFNLWSYLSALGHNELSYTVPFISPIHHNTTPIVYQQKPPPYALLLSSNTTSTHNQATSFNHPFFLACWWSFKHSSSIEILPVWPWDSACWWHKPTPTNSGSVGRADMFVLGHLVLGNICVSTTHGCVPATETVHLHEIVVMTSLGTVRELVQLNEMLAVGRSREMIYFLFVQWQ